MTKMELMHKYLRRLESAARTRRGTKSRANAVEELTDLELKIRKAES